MQQRTDRRRGHHRRWQPTVERHQCGLTNTERVECQQDRNHWPGDMTLKNSTFGEIKRSRHRIGPYNCHKLQPDRSAYENARYVRAPLTAALVPLWATSG